MVGTRGLKTMESYIRRHNRRAIALSIAVTFIPAIALLAFVIWVSDHVNDVEKKKVELQLENRIILIQSDINRTSVALNTIDQLRIASEEKGDEFPVRIVEQGRMLKVSLSNLEDQLSNLNEKLQK